MRRALVVSLFAVLAGCGGGGSTGGGTIPTVAPTATPAFAPVVVGMTQTSPTTLVAPVSGNAHAVTVAIYSQAPDQDSLTPARFSSATLTVTTAAGAQTSTRAPGMLRPPADAVSVDGDALVAARLRAAAHNLRGGGSQGTRAALPRIRALPTTLGASANIWVEEFALGSNNTVNVQVPATLSAITDHGYVWIDSTLLAGANAFSAATIAALAADFENGYASDLAHFGSPHYPSSAPGVSALLPTCDANGVLQPATMPGIFPETDPHVNFVVLASLGPGVGGYFDSTNYAPQPVANCFGTFSNQGAFFFVAWFGATNGTDYELRENFVKGTAHELQHMINFIAHSIISPNGYARFAATGQGDLGFEDVFINEGLSMLSQDLAIDRMFPGQGYDVDQALGRAAVFLAAPHHYSLSGFMGTEPGATSPHYNCHFGCYGAAYLFARYQYNRFGGDRWSSGMETSGLEGFANLQANGGGEPGNAIIGDFATAIGAAGSGVADPRFSFAPLNITQFYPNQFGGGLAMAGVTPADALAPGLARFYTVPLGGFIYLRASSLPATGLSVSVGDPAGTFGLAGALVEQ